MNRFKQDRPPHGAPTAEDFEEIARTVTETASRIPAVRRLPETERRDVYQEVVLRIAERIHNRPQEAIRDLGPYARRTLTSVLIQRGVQIGALIPTESDELQRQLDARQCDRAAETMAERLRIEEAIGRLPKELREVIVLTYFGDMAPAEISERLKISTSAVHRRKRKALKLLKPILEAREPGGTS